ncbi:MAG TPA: LURP-one-related family protein, partial [Faecalibacter sp.]
MSINQLQFPLDFKFHIATISNDFSVTDATGQSVFYVREKMFTWRDRIKVYSDSKQTALLYELTSNKLIDFQQTFTIT